MSSLLLLLLSVDYYLNGPRPSRARAGEAALALSALAALAGGPLASALAQLAWIAVFLDALAADARAKAEARRAERERAEAAEAQGGAGAGAALLVPELVEEELARGKAAFLRHVDPAKNALGHAWRLASDADGVRVFESDFPGQSSKWWRVVCEDVPGTVALAYPEIFDYAVRCPPKGWDSALERGSVIKRYKPRAGRDVEVCVYYTAPQAGGAVSPREVVDVGLVEELPSGGVLYVNLTPSKEAARLLPEIPSKVTGVRATTHLGSGIRIEPNGRGGLRYELVVSLALGGWLPASIVNQATAQALSDSHKTMIAHLAKVAAAAPT